jgi:hypothetical protein
VDEETTSVDIEKDLKYVLSKTQGGEHNEVTFRMIFGKDQRYPGTGHQQKPIPGYNPRKNS